jgi:FkbM family methyltransferase
MAKIIVPDVDFKVRLRSMDTWVLHEVLYQNVYRLPPSMAGQSVYDIGANIGAFAAACLARGARKVHCVEPHPGSFRLLTENTKDSKKVTRRQTAVWVDGVGEVRFSTHGGYSAAWRCLCDNERAEEEVVVPATTLDRILPASPFGVLKLDCEGGEWPGVYQSRRVANARTILMETHESISVAGFDCTADGMIKHLEALGFKCETYTEGAQAAVGQVYLKATNRKL